MIRKTTWMATVGLLLALSLLAVADTTLEGKMTELGRFAAALLGN